MAMLPARHARPGVRGAASRRSSRRSARRSIRSPRSSRWTSTGRCVRKPHQQRLVLVGRITPRSLSLIVAILVRQTAARQLRPGVPVHPGVHRLLHAGHLRDLPARHVLGAHHRDSARWWRPSVPRCCRSRSSSAWPSLPFMDRVGVVFLACFAIAIVISLLQPPRQSGAARRAARTSTTRRAPASTSRRSSSPSILIALYATWW